MANPVTETSISPMITAIRIAPVRTLLMRTIRVFEMDLPETIAAERAKVQQWPEHK